MFASPTIRIILSLLLAALSMSSIAGTWPRDQGSITLDEPPKRIVTLNWAATEALLLLGITPVGVADKEGYSVWVGQPKLPETVANIGTRMAPSLEAIAELGPDLIVTSTEMAPAAELLESIAPTYVISLYKKGSAPFAKAREMLTTLADMTRRQEPARQLLQDLDRELEYQRQRLREHGVSDKPVALMSFLDSRHVRLYTNNGLFQTALDALGLSNAWPHPGNYWGFTVVGLDAIADYPDSRLVVIGPAWPGLSEQLAASPFWTYLPPVRNGQVYQTDQVWPFGGIYSVQRLAISLADALIHGGGNNVH